MGNLITSTPHQFTRKDTHMTLAFVFLIASFVIAVVRRSVSATDLALWAIATALILPHLKFLQ